MTYSIDLTVAWACVIAFAIFAYIVMDGFDLGIGIMFVGLKPGVERDTAMNSVAPVWDGNETWLVLGGGGLFAAFPLAYSIIMPALYAPILVMLLGLVFRGVAFEFRWRDDTHRPYWDAAFAGGSVIAAFAQGTALGALLQGIAISGRAFGGGGLDWVTPFTMLTGVSLVIGYALLGSTWLILKSTGTLQARCRSVATPLAFATLGCIILVSAATPFISETYLQRWFSWPRLLYTAPVPIIVAAVGAALLTTLRTGAERAPFLLSLGLFLLSFVGLGISIYPDVVPTKLTIWQAASPASSQLFILVGSAVLIPIILTYTGYAYWVFRGKVSEDGYHG